jgi:hypothetical protein
MQLQIHAMHMHLHLVQQLGCIHIHLPCVKTLDVMKELQVLQSRQLQVVSDMHAHQEAADMRAPNKRSSRWLHLWHNYITAH